MILRMDFSLIIRVSYLFLLILPLAILDPSPQESQHTAPGKKRKTMKYKRIKTTPTPAKGTEELDQKQIMQRIMTNYVRSDPPIPDRPTEVKLGIYVISFFAVTEQTMDYKVTMYFRQSWRDPRLNYTHLSSTIKKFRLGSEFYIGNNSVWLPDTFFRNEKKASFHKITVDNRMMRLSNDGSIWYVTKITAVLTCPMKLEKYPMDTQVCPILFESFGYTMDTMYFAWLDTPVDVNPKIQIPQFTRVDELLYDCSQNYTSGAYPCQEIRFRLQREIGYFVIQVFFPSILVVILSWVSFWINIDGVPARVSIGLLTVLTTTSQSASISATLPRVSYIKAIDVWTIMCLIFVFTALLEYALVNVAARNGVKIRTPVVRQPPLRTIDVESRNGQDSSNRFGCWKSDSGPQLYTITIDAEGCKRRARYIDKIARKTFPLAFLLFNLVYWITYSILPSLGQHSDEGL